MDIDYTEGTSDDTTVTGSALTLSGNVEAITIKAYDANNVMTCSKTIPVSGKSVSIKEQSRWYYAGETITGFTPSVDVFEDSYETSYWSKTAIEPTETVPTVWYYDKTVFVDNTVFRTTPTAMRWSAPYSIIFDNDSASIAANADGVVDADTLEAVSTVTVTVYHGTEDITNNCTFSWTPNGGTLSATSGKTIHFDSLTNDTAQAVVTVVHVTGNDELGNVAVGSRAFVISKSKQAATYKLSATPNSWNKTEAAFCMPVFSITKYGAGDPQTLTYEPNNISDIYAVKVNGSDWDGAAIRSTTIFELYVSGEKVDSETVTSTNGVQSIVNWYKAHSSNTSPPAGRGTSDGWSKTTPTLDASTNKYLWGYEIITYSSDNVIVTDKHYITAYGDTGVHGTEAEAIRIFISSTTNSAPATPTSGLGNWSTSEIPASSTAKFVFTSTGVKTTVYNEAGGSTTTYGSWTTPELWGAYASANIDQKSYATFLKLMNGKEGGMEYDTTDGKLYIKSEFIKSNNILVTDSSDKVVFSATAGSGGSIELAGFNVSTVPFGNGDTAKNKMYYGIT
jgi:hypothetical protein